MGYVLAVVNDASAFHRRCTVPPRLLVIEVASIAQATKLVSAAIPDAVFIEHQLRDGYGVQLAQFLKMHPSLSQVPVVLLDDSPTALPLYGNLDVFFAPDKLEYRDVEKMARANRHPA
jgi:hypothetical protein